MKMTYGDFKEMMRKSMDFLDTLDLDKFIENENDVEEIMNAIEDEYDDTPILPDFLEGCVFNYLSENEFADYLADRYNKKWVEITTTKYYLK